MKNGIFWFVLLIGLSFTLLVLWLFVHAKKERGESSRIDQAEEKISAIVDTLQIDMITVADPSGRVIVVVRNPKESLTDWYKRADDIQNGLGISSQNCKTLHCTNGVVTICISCMVNETPAECQARLDEAVKVYCQTHTCDEC